MPLVRCTKFVKDNSLVILCNSEVAKETNNGGQVRDFIQRMFLDRDEYKEELENIKNVEKVLKTNKIRKKMSVLTHFF